MGPKEGEVDASDGRMALRLRVLTSVMHSFAEATSDYDRLLVTVAARLSEVLKNTCVLQLLSEDRETLVPVAVEASDPAVRDHVEALLARHPIRVESHALYRRLVETGEPILIPKVESDRAGVGFSGRHRSVTDALQMHSGLMVALRLRGEIIGTLSMGRYEPELPPYDEQDRELAQTLADHAALAITNARSLQAAQAELAERLKAEVALQKTEAQLRRAQKLEAIGNLAGGIAHDFNNVLSVILSHTELLIEDMKPGDPVRVQLEEVHAAGQRAADLTRQLLAFGRQQILQARPVSMNDVAARTEKMLRRLIGEDIELAFLPAAELGSANVDPSQIEQVLMNLVVNARDAMPRGGKLTIETANCMFDDEYAATHVGVAPGPYVMLAVSDTGVGMDQATQARIFEPFFTTKEQGKGTGLGLSTVFGIVKQLSGHIWVYSEPGKGTTFKVYFPRSDEPARPMTTAEAPATLRGSETILIVEDENGVRSLVRQILERHGYNVLEAEGGDDALIVCQRHSAAIDLLITDVIMPRMSGREVADRLSVIHPEMKVLYMSGYTDKSIVHHGILDPGISYLQKPIRPGALTIRVREVLDATRASERRPQLARSGASTPEAPAARRARVLVIDDEPVLVKLFVRALRQERDVTGETHARAALARIAAGERFDLIFCDLGMPEMSGVEFLGELRSIAPELVPRLVFLTGGATTPAAHRLLAEHSNPRIEKPISATALRAFVMSFLA